MPTYWLDVFTGKSWEEFLAAGGRVSGFKELREPRAAKMKPGDILLCYVAGVSRWIAALRVTGPMFMSNDRIWADDLYPVRVPCEIVVDLAPAHSVPMTQLLEDFSWWDDSKSSRWGVHLQGPPTQMKREDGELVFSALESAKASPVERPVDPRKWGARPRVFTDAHGQDVTLPEDDTIADGVADPETTSSTHTELQYLLARTGHELGLKVWIARNDRNRQSTGGVLGELPGVVTKLPMQFDPLTMQTIEHIDVLWLRSNAIEAAFEIEHTTSVYSGLLRMADLVAMQPNLNIRLFIVAPDDKRQKVLDQIGRPAFAHLKTPLHLLCQYISYGSLEHAVEQYRPMLHHMQPSFLDEIAESTSAK